MLSTKSLFHRVRPYLSFEYLHATMDNNLPIAADNGSIDFLRTEGRTPIIMPKFMGSVGLTYTAGPLFLNTSIRYTDKQYSTF
ncbi:hypothetical protein [Gluconobacter kanchanaburiensis]|nr:hypothetical protein [Gluconobacter kanchanaburiensis]GBR68543.1 hypothetical protein AA103587_0858 [Gluconobacter kanchanaburiensis NBRC 103587]